MIASPANASQIEKGQKTVNDFSINIATVNGSGSQTANTAILRALFKMGIPVNGKNLFPSNIKGLPTWYIIRVSKDGYIARRDGAEILVAMNQKTVEEDHNNLVPGGVCFYNEGLRFERNRNDITYYAMPVKRLVKGINVPSSLRSYIVNMVYVGVLASVLGLDVNEIENALLHHFKGKAKPAAMNMEAVNAACAWANENITKTDPYAIEAMNKTEGMIMIDGNTAAALGSIYGGVSVVAWYPITPSTSIIDGISHYMPKLRAAPESGQKNYAIIQAEDELAAIGMIIGAGWAGARAMTATSGPGISLMTEFSGLGYFAEIPAVIWDVMRMGPSTGLPTRTAQGDILSTYTLGHGDTKQVCLLPASMAECFEFGWQAFDIAEQLQTPVFILSDLDLGMNQWLSPQFDYPEQPMNRGKVLTAEALDQLEDYGRYRDVDGDGIPYRTLPNTNHRMAPFMTRGTGHNEDAVYSERPDDWENNLNRLARKLKTAANIIPAPIADLADGAEIGLIAYGSVHHAVIEARDLLAKQGLKTGYLRIRALPLKDSVEEFMAQHKRVYVIENNFNGQMRQILNMEYPHLAPKTTSLAHCDGLPLTAGWIVDALIGD